MKNEKFFIIVTPYFLPHIGGIEYYVEGFARELVRRRYNVVIITSSHKDTLFIEGSNPTIIRIASYNLFDRIPLPYHVGQLAKIYREYLFQKDSIVMIHTRFFPLSWIIAMMCRFSNTSSISRLKIIHSGSDKEKNTLRERKRIHHVIVEHGSGHFTYKNLLMTNLIHWYEHIVTTIIKFTRPYVWYGVSRASCKWLSHFGIQTDHVVSNGIDSLLRSKKQKMTSMSPYIFYAGRLVAQKGIEELIEGFRLFNQTGIYTLVIAGCGELEKYIQVRSQKDSHISYIGHITRSKALVYMQSSWVYVCPTKYPEGLPTTLLEAGLCRVPVIAGAQGGIRDLIHHEVNGYIIDPVTPKTIDAALRVLEKNPSLASKIGSALHKDILRDYNWETIVGQFLHTTNGILRHTRAQ